MVNNRTPKLFKKETYVKMINLCEVALIDKSDNLDLLYTKRKSERVLEELTLHIVNTELSRAITNTIVLINVSLEIFKSLIIIIPPLKIRSFYF